MHKSERLLGFVFTIVAAASACGRDAITADAMVDAVTPDAMNDANPITVVQQEYLKASNTGTGGKQANFGSGIALSSDGSTLAVGAICEASAATGIDGNQTDSSAPCAGAVYVFTRNGAAWSQQAYVKASNTSANPAPSANDMFGASVAVSSDGSTLAVGAPAEASAAIGINGNQLDNSAPNSGAVYVFTRNGATWSQQAYVKASNTGSLFVGQGDAFGSSVTLSADGDTLAVGAPGEASAATGINGNQADNSADAAGAVYVFTRTGTVWSQQAYVKASNTNQGDGFGGSFEREHSNVVLSADGNTLAVGAIGEASLFANDQTNNAAPGAGAVYVFTRTGSTWSQQAYVKASNIGLPVSNSNDHFGANVALSTDGSTLAVSSPFEYSAATGIDGNQQDNSAPLAGAVYVFTRAGTTWTQEAYVKASNTDKNDVFGTRLALTADGSTLAVGADGESSAATGIDGNQADNSAPSAGAVYLFARTGTTWSQHAYVKASNTGFGDRFSTVALTADGSSLVVGADGEASVATGIGGDQTDNSAPGAGAVYVFTMQR